MISKLARFTLVPMFAVALASGVALAQDPPAEGEGAPAEGTGEAMPAEATPAAETAPMESSGGDMAMEKKMHLGADVGAAIPILTPYSDGAGIGFGGLLRFEYVLSPMLHVTARAGYIHHLAKNSVTFSQIPILVGAKYFFGQVYGAAEVGFSMNKAKLDGGGSASENKFASGVAGGYMMGKLDIRVGLNMPNTAKAGDGFDILATVGFNFAAF